jgi:hypothetical protein
MCVGCRKRREKRELIRLVRNAVGAFVPDEKKNLPGRGVYLCPSPDCIARAQKKQLRGILRMGPEPLREDGFPGSKERGDRRKMNVKE